MNEQWIVVGSAPGTDLSVIKPLVEKNIPVICADGGIKTVADAGITPNFFVGDLDSGYKPESVDSVILPKEKDYTDLHTALLWAADNGARQVYIAGCTNGRADHYFANVLLLEMLSEREICGVIMDFQNRIFYHGGGTIKVKKGDESSCSFFNEITMSDDFKYVSVLPLDSEISGVTLNGFKYPLDNATLKRNTPIGVSNELNCPTGEICIKSGRALVIISKDV